MTKTVKTENSEDIFLENLRAGKHVSILCFVLNFRNTKIKKSKNPFLKLELCLYQYFLRI